MRHCARLPAAHASSPKADPRVPKNAPFSSEPLNDRHVLTSFRSTNDSLDRWLRESAARASAHGTGRAWVWHTGDREVVGYFTLVAHLVHREALSRTQGRSLPREVPGILIAKLALSEHLHGQGLGEQLLLDALSRCVAAGEVVGSHFVVVDAIDAAAETFYMRYGLQPLPDTTPTRLLRRLASIATDLHGM